jgi:hypothetical protein
MKTYRRMTPRGRKHASHLALPIVGSSYRELDRARGDDDDG